MIEAEAQKLTPRFLRTDSPTMGCSVKPVLLPSVAAVLIALGAAAHGAPAAPQVQTLDGDIGHVELTAGVETIGGASVEDAVAFLYRHAAFPVSLEQVEYDRSKKADVVTLGSAIAKLHRLQGVHALATGDEWRLNAYEEEIKKGQDPSTMILFDHKAFTVVEDNMTVRALLDRATALDDAYSWHNDGTDAAPIIVIEPRGKSVLEWSAPAICPPAGLSFAKLYGPGGKLTELFGQHDISQMTWSEGPVDPASANKRSAPPDVQLDLCRDHLVARDVLNLTVTALGGNASWELAGMKGLRFLTFHNTDQ